MNNLDESNKIGLYIHVPFCKSKCYYCDFNSFAGADSAIDDYFLSLKGELVLYSGIVKDAEIETIFIGGGTPSYVDAQHIESVLDVVYHNFNITPGAEITIETNPGTLSFKKLSAYREKGINRISMGLQAWQDNVLCSIGRIHTIEEFLQNYKEARRAGFNNINIDLIFGLPEQTLEQWEETVDHVISINPEHVSCYSLKIEEETRFGNLLEKGKIKAVDDELDREMYYLVKDKLGKAGYRHYEISNFAKNNHECRHNMIYWKAREYIGVGAGAHSYYNGLRYNNVYSIGDYIKQISENKIPKENTESIDRDDSISEYVILGLRLTEGIDLSDFKAKFNEDLVSLFKDAVLKCEERKLLFISDGKLKLTEKGLDLANYVMSEFL